MVDYTHSHAPTTGAQPLGDCTPGKVAGTKTQSEQHSEITAGAGNHHAQRSILHRLQHAYGAQARMTAGWREGYYVVELRLPVTVARGRRRMSA